MSYYNAYNLPSPGVDGNVMTANSGVWTSAAGGGGSFKSLSPYIVGDVNSDYASIQDAIDAAALAGATTTAPQNVYLKPKSDGSDYVEDLNIPAGIFLIGLDQNYETTQVLNEKMCSVSILGSHTLSGDGVCQFKFQNLNLKNDNGIFFTSTCSTVSSHLIAIINCFQLFASNGNASTLCAGSDPVSQYFYLNKVLQVDNGDSTLFLDANLTGSYSGLGFEIYNSKVISRESSTCSKDISIFFQGRYNTVQVKLDIQDPCTCDIEYYYSYISRNCIIGTSNSLAFYNCFVDNQLDIGSISPSTFNLIQCISFASFVSAQPQMIGCTQDSCGYKKVSSVQTSAYTTTVTDGVIPCDTTSSAFTVTLYPTPFDGMTQTIKDVGGNALVNNITIAGNVDGSAGGTLITLAFGSKNFTWNSSLSTWMVT